MLVILYYRCMQIHLLKGTHMYTHTHTFFITLYLGSLLNVCPQPRLALVFTPHQVLQNWFPGPRPT